MMHSGIMPSTSFIMHIDSSFRASLALLAALYAPVLATAAETAQPATSHYLGKADCRIAHLEPAPDNGEVSWTGSCVDGYASGKGVLTWTASRLGKVTLEATLVRGEADGKAVFGIRDFIYEGTTRNGMPHGEGYIQKEGWGWYEGEVAGGLPHGKGTHVRFDRSRYTGDWIKGQHHGQGEATFATGGSYAGGWKNGKFDGQGTIVYAGAGHKYTGLFQDGRIAGLPKAEVAKGSYDSDGEVRAPLPNNGIVAYLPMKSAWDQLTAAQQNTFRGNYPALEAGDEPPFPLKGEGSLFEKVERMNQTFGLVQGKLSVYVLVGKDGKPLSVTAYGAPTATFTRALSTLFMLEQYKPALCRGVPCDMVYPVNFSFTVAD